MNYKSMVQLTAIVVILTQLLTACSDKQQAAAGEAIASLRKIEAAIQVGVSYQQYGILLIDAKSKVNDANAVLPDGELKNKLNAAMDAYVEAGQVWGIKINGPNLLPDREPGATLMRKYSLKPHTVSSLSLTYIDPDEAMQAAWGTAMGHLLLAQKQLEEQ